MFAFFNAHWAPTYNLVVILYGFFVPSPLHFFRQGIVCTIHCVLLYFLWREDARKGANLVNKVKFWNFHTLPRPLGTVRHWIRIKTLLQEIYKLIFQTYEKWKPALIISGRKSNRKRVKGKLKTQTCAKIDYKTSVLRENLFKMFKCFVQISVYST